MPEPISLPDAPESLPAHVVIQRPPAAEAAAVFIHGLGGDLFSTWGRKGEPGTFLTRLAADLPNVAVATFGYATGLKRTVDPVKLDIGELARIWAHTLRDDFLDPFSSIAVICHSLGGVITQAALHHLLSTEDSWARKLRDHERHFSVLMMGVPQHGTTRAVKGSSILSQELEVLQYNSETVRQNTSFWQSRVRPPETLHEDEGAIPIAAFAVVSEADFWVPQLSAGAGLAEKYIKRVALSHTGMVKPPASGHFPPYDFVLQRLRPWIRTLGRPRHVQTILDRLDAGRRMVFDRVEIDRIVERPWLDARVDAAVAERKGGYVHLEAQAGAGKTAYLARFVREREVPSFFFDASQGITSVEELHQALWAQLIVLGRLPARPTPEGLGTDARVLRGVLDQAAQAADAPLLLVVDALDEAEAAAGLPGLLPMLPANVTVLTSARLGTSPPPNALAVPIDIEAADSEDDVRRYIRSRADGDDLRAVLASESWSRQQLVHQVSRQAGGLFAHAHFVLSDLASGRLGLGDLESLPPGLDWYYELTWHRWRDADAKHFRSVLRPALAAVAVARAPVLPEWVARWTGLDPSDAEEALRKQLRPWVTPSASAHRTRYRLYHQSVRDFLQGTAEVALQGALKKIADTCWGHMRGENGDDPTFQAYADEHGLRHLLEASRFDEATELLTDLVFLDRHREAAGNSAILAELLALRAVSPSSIVEHLLHAWSDEAFAIDDRPSLLSQFSYVLCSHPQLRDHLRAPLRRLARHTERAWLRCCRPVNPRSTFSFSLRGHKDRVSHCVLGADDRHLVSASGDGTLRLWDLDAPDRESRVLRGHGGEVTHCVLSSDERYLVSASNDGTLRVWDLNAPDREPQVLQGHESAVTHCALTSDDRRLVSASADCTLRVWDLAALDQEPRVLQGHSGWITYCVLSSDDRFLVSASADSTLRVWDLTALDREPRVLRGHEDWVTHCVLSSDDGCLVSASDDGTLYVWDLAAPDLAPFVLRGHEDWVHHCVLSSDDRRLISASGDGTLRVWDLDALKREPHVLRGHEDRVFHSVLTSDDQLLVSASDDGTLRVWDLNVPDRKPRVLRGHEGGISHCVLSSDDRRLVSASADSTLRIWNLDAPDSRPSAPRGHEDWIAHCVLSTDHQRLVSASHDGTLRVWDLGDPESEPIVLRGHEDRVVHSVLSSDKQRLVSASWDGTLRVWDLAAPDRKPRVLRGHEGPVTRCILSADDQRLISGSVDDTLRIWHLDTPARETCVLRSHQGGVSHCVLSSDERCLVSASYDGTLRVWDLEALDREPRVLRGHEEWVTHCVLSSDDRRLVSASVDSTLRVWDLDASEHESRILRGHEDGVTHCILSSNGRCLVSASGDGTLRVWDLEASAGKPRVLQGHEGEVRHCALSSEDRRLVSASNDGTLRVWDLRSDEQLAKFRAAGIATWVRWAKNDCWVLAADSSGRVWFLELMEGHE